MDVFKIEDVEFHKVNSDPNSDFDIEIVRKKEPKKILYRNPKDRSKCWEFVLHISKVPDRMVCKNCDRICSERSTCYGNTDILSTEFDPAMNHLVGCRGTNFSEYIRKYPIYNEDGEGMGKYEYQFVILGKAREYKVLYRLPENPSLCYRFTFVKRTYNFATVKCGMCDTLSEFRHYRKDPVARYKCTPSGFAENCRLRHDPQCEPREYNEVMLNYDLMDQDIGNKILQFAAGEVEHDYAYNPARCSQLGEPEPYYAETLVLEKKQVNYVYRLPHDPTKCHMFHAHGRQAGRERTKKEVTLLCTNCISARKRKDKNRTLRTESKAIKSDGFSCKIDPAADHQEFCRTYDYALILKEYYPLYDAPLGEGKYEFSLERMRKKNQHIVACKLPDNPKMCYRFLQISRTTSGVLLICLTCKMRTSRDAFVARLHYQCDEFGFINNPFLGHLGGCDPVPLDEVLASHKAASIDTARRILYDVRTEEINPEENTTGNNMRFVPPQASRGPGSDFVQSVLHTDFKQDHELYCNEEPNRESSSPEVKTQAEQNQENSRLLSITNNSANIANNTSSGVSALSLMKHPPGYHHNNSEVKIEAEDVITTYTGAATSTAHIRENGIPLTARDLMSKEDIKTEAD